MWGTKTKTNCKIRWQLGDCAVYCKWRQDCPLEFTKRWPLSINGLKCWRHCWIDGAVVASEPTPASRRAGLGCQATDSMSCPNKEPERGQPSERNGQRSLRRPQQFAGPRQIQRKRIDHTTDVGARWSDASGSGLLLVSPSFQVFQRT